MVQNGPWREIILLQRKWPKLENGFLKQQGGGSPGKTQRQTLTFGLKKIIPTYLIFLFLYKTVKISWFKKMMYSLVSYRGAGKWILLHLGTAGCWLQLHIHCTDMRVVSTFSSHSQQAREFPKIYNVPWLCQRLCSHIIYSLQISKKREDIRYNGTGNKVDVPFHDFWAESCKVNSYFSLYNVQHRPVLLWLCVSCLLGWIIFPVCIAAFWVFFILYKHMVLYC